LSRVDSNLFKRHLGEVDIMPLLSTFVYMLEKGYSVLECLVIVRQIVEYFGYEVDWPRSKEFHELRVSISDEVMKLYLEWPELRDFSKVDKLFYNAFAKRRFSNASVL